MPEDFRQHTSLGVHWYDITFVSIPENAAKFNTVNWLSHRTFMVLWECTKPLSSWYQQIEWWRRFQSVTRTGDWKCISAILDQLEITPKTWKRLMLEETIVQKTKIKLLSDLRQYYFYSVLSLLKRKCQWHQNGSEEKNVISNIKWKPQSSFLLKYYFLLCEAYWRPSCISAINCISTITGNQKLQ